ncbi:MAG: 2-C-methyl-D-erythritol 4-phosphate cytidylyltransferase, partial [Propionibacteriaceae bacterium]|nr:2-C-methyl-D-erythritol 4-phosphate cytidylyltransferase [Propionibacteriaceae bacterium]
NQADRVQVVTGGLLRQDSVRLGLASAPDATTVLVHDAARPLVPPFLVTMVLAAVRDGADVVVPVLPVTDSLRRLRRDGSSPVDRSDFVRVQTPQGFKADLLRQAHLAIGDREYSDDASLCESIGAHVQTVPGDPLAFKITEPLDLKLAETVVRGEA